MAIDTKSLSQLITELRKFTAKDSVSPESLGYILQCIADLLLPAGTSETVAELKKILDGFKKFGEVVTSISQGKADPNHVYANINSADISNGAIFTTSGIFIQQATTERAGAKRA